MALQTAEVGMAEDVGAEIAGDALIAVEVVAVSLYHGRPSSPSVLIW